jgi:hypothetical protein
MLFPSASVFVVGAVLSMVLLAVDWYVWGLNSKVYPRRPRYVVPMTGVELVDLALGRIIASNRATLPRSAFVATRCEVPSTTTDPSDGFKHVA